MALTRTLPFFFKTMPSEATTPMKIRPSTAQRVIKAVSCLYDFDVLDYQELCAIKSALNGLARRGTLAPEPEKKLLDLHQVADKLSIGESTLKRGLADGSIPLPKVRIGGSVRFRLEDVVKLIDSVEPETEDVNHD